MKKFTNKVIFKIKKVKLNFWLHMFVSILMLSGKISERNKDSFLGANYKM